MAGVKQIVPLALSSCQPCFTEQLQLFGYGGLRDSQNGGELLCAMRALPEQLENPQPCGIAKGFELAKQILRRGFAAGQSGNIHGERQHQAVCCPIDQQVREDEGGRKHIHILQIFIGKIVRHRLLRRNPPFCGMKTGMKGIQRFFRRTGEGLLKLGSSRVDPGHHIVPFLAEVILFIRLQSFNQLLADRSRMLKQIFAGFIRPVISNGVCPPASSLPFQNSAQSNFVVQQQKNEFSIGLVFKQVNSISCLQRCTAAAGKH
ncbi:hypothetical protein D3C74_331360 [compost metagenome]